MKQEITNRSLIIDKDRLFGLISFHFFQQLSLDMPRQLGVRKRKGL